MTDIAAALHVIAAWPEVAGPLTRAGEACTALRWHEGLRRRAPEAAAESRVRGARASAELDGARSTDDVVRSLVIGATPWPERPDPTLAVIRGAVQATAEAEHAGKVLRTSPRQALARLHTAAAQPLLEPAERDLLGRPRPAGTDCAEFGELGSAPADPGPRLAGVLALLERMSDPGSPVLLVAALVHAEIALTRPFVRGNGVVARALERALVHAGGVDPTGVAVPEVGHLRRGGTPYVGALAAYDKGTRAGISLWIAHVCDAVVDGAAEGERIASAVRAGRLD